MIEREFPGGSPRRLLPTEVFHGLEIGSFNIPSIRGALDGRKICRAGHCAAAQLDAEDAFARGASTLIENAEAIVRQHALHDELTLLQLLTLDEIARRTLFRSPDNGHRLKILGANRGKELFDGGPRRGGAGERAAGSGAARDKDRNERERQALHGESPLVR